MPTDDVRITDASPKWAAVLALPEPRPFDRKIKCNGNNVLIGAII